MEEALVRMGFMTRRAAPDQTPAAPGGSLPLLGKSGLRRLGRRLLPDALRKSLKPWYRRTIGEEPPVDEDRTQVFFESSVGNSYLRINLVGRYPNGAVPAAEYDKLLHEIERELYALVNPATGTPVVKHVYFPWRMFNGPKRDSLPDISIQWNSQYRVDSMESETIGRVAKPFVDNRSGNHNTEAFLLCRGPGFVDGHVQVEADSRQLAPTVFSLLNETPPEHYELGPVSDVLQSGDVVAFSSWRRRAV